MPVAAVAVCFDKKIQRCRGAGARLWLVAALCVSRMALLVSAVACTGFRVDQHRTNERVPPTAPRRTERARVKIESARAVPRAGGWYVVFVARPELGRWAVGPRSTLHKPRSERGQARAHLAYLE